MPHIHTKPGEHDLTTCAYIIRTDGDKPRIWLHMHRKLHYLLPAGGHVELTETPWQAVLHEIREETGYDKSQLRLLQPTEHAQIQTLTEIDLHPQPLVLLTHEVIPNHFHTDISWAFVADSEPQHPLSDHESHDIQLLTKSELIKLPEGSLPENIRETYLYILDVALLHWDQLPID